MTNEQIEQSKIISEFLGAEVRIGYQRGDYIQYVVRGKSVLMWRDSGLLNTGYRDGMLLENTRFVASWDWLWLAIVAIHNHPDCPSGLIIDDIHHRCYHEKGNKIFEADSTFDAVLKGVIWSINWLNNKDNDSKRKTD